MPIAKWNSERTLSPIANWVDDFFADTNDWFRFHWKNSSDETMPAVNVSETSDAWQLDVAAPGFSKEDFKVEVKNGRMTISAEKEGKSEEKEAGKVTRREFNYHSFSRSFTLPENVNPDGVSAKYTDGMLKVSVPKARLQDESPALKIAVN